MSPTTRPYDLRPYDHPTTIDTRPLYHALAAAGLATHALELGVLEEGRRAPLRITVARAA